MGYTPNTLIVAIVLAIPLFTKLSLTTFVSINCGSSEPFTDPQTNITWTQDDAYIEHGQSFNVSLGLGTFSTLRAFHTLKKNCYEIEVQKGEKVLTRASFFYGNYDNKFSPPMFDLIFDGNYWGTVITSISDHVDYEAIYVAKGNYTNVCVSQSNPNHIPFISSIEVRGLDPQMYNHLHQNHSLILLSRRAFGANQTVRYPDDVYDRIWIAKNSDQEFIYSIQSEALDINISTVEDQPPKSAIQNAFTLPNTTFGIQYNISSLLQSTSDTNNNYNSSMNSLYFHASPGSTLPPLINAAEVYRIEPLAQGTDSRDVEGLRQLRLAFKTLSEWKGDPCLPFPYAWEWIQCTADPKPRVKALNLSSYDLNGILPDMRSMDALEIIDLHNNTIEGPIPEFLGFLPLLRVLNLSYNSFNGYIPNSLNNTDIDIDITHLPELQNVSITTTSDSPTRMSFELHILLLIIAKQILSLGDMGNNKGGVGLLYGSRVPPTFFDELTHLFLHQIPIILEKDSRKSFLSKRFEGSHSKNCSNLWFSWNCFHSPTH
ncbi:probable LRR receptor-like serine/threonine-protein kinase At1g05700 [Arachis duranensis]|uniref:Probable LRR receptor-like serine/threonine-protein kinase At1g05700 n=1 Tax=Arachis duranensis TaxID=130453 RepID=A0A9C6WQ85_ARADU|nr:probable LRR receptor-like serine/threonine-protein kinase At1g05700 [Arachis duranensis]